MFDYNLGELIYSFESWIKKITSLFIQILDCLEE